MSTADYTLAPDGAFVVQFAAGSRSQPAVIAGRVEHVQSGRAGRFHSVDELLAFFAAVLGAHADPADAMTIAPAHESLASIDDSTAMTMRSNDETARIEIQPRERGRTP